MHAREVQALVKHSGFGRAVTEEDRRKTFLPAQPCAEGRTDPAVIRDELASLDPASLS